MVDALSFSVALSFNVRKLNREISKQRKHQQPDSSTQQTLTLCPYIQYKIVTFKASDLLRKNVTSQLMRLWYLPHR